MLNRPLIQQRWLWRASLHWVAMLLLELQQLILLVLVLVLVLLLLVRLVESRPLRLGNKRRQGGKKKSFVRDGATTDKARRAK